MSELSELRRVAKRRERIEAEYRTAMLAAVAERGYAETARVLGVTKQAVRQQVLRWKREQPT